MKRIIHVAGLQKSGTSLLVRLLENTGMAEFLGGRGKTEGGIDWGNRPSFTPTAFPAGVIYQRNSGNEGHEIGAADATPDTVEYVRRNVETRLGSLPTEIGDQQMPVQYGSASLDQGNSTWHVRCCRCQKAGLEYLLSSQTIPERRWNARPARWLVGC